MPPKSPPAKTTSPKKSDPHVDRVTRETLEKMKCMMDIDGDGKVQKDEYKRVYMKIHPTISPGDYDKVWTAIDKDGNGELSFTELATHYGFTEGAGDATMSDEQILEALQAQAALQELEDKTVARRASMSPPGTRCQRTSVGLAMPVGGASSLGLFGDILTVKMPSKLKVGGTKEPEVEFLEACDLGDLADLKKLLVDQKLKPLIQDEKGEMASHKLARTGNVALFRLLLDHSGGADASKLIVNWQDKAGRTPLMNAAEYEHIDLVNMLLTRGADVTTECGTGWTALHCAVSGNNEGVLRAILSHDKVAEHKLKLVNSRDKQLRSALHIAAYKSNEDMVQVLLTFGADPSLEDEGGHKAVTLASKAGRRRSKELLTGDSSEIMAKSGRRASVEVTT